MSSIRSALVLCLSAAAVCIAQSSVADLPGCGQTCANSMIQDKATSLGCPGGSIPCLCANSQFLLGLHDCAVGACNTASNPSAAVAQVDAYGVALCASATAPAPTTTTAPPTTAPTTTPAAPIPTTSVSTPPVVPVTTPSTSSSTVPPTTSPSPVIPAVSSTSSSSSATSTETAIPAASTSSGESSPGLTTAAKVGIGIGAAAGGVALIALAACLLITRRHKNKSRDSRLEISDPLPGSGRTYADDHHHKQYETSGGKSELEMKSRRYEDMVPRQSPRTMV